VSEGSEGGPLAAPWLVDGAVVAAELGVDPAAGLGGSEAQARLERFGWNRLDPERPVPTWRKLLRQFADPLVYLLLAAVAVSILTWVIDGAHNVPFEPIVIGAILIANAVLGFAQEARAEQAVAALQRIAAPMSDVMRDGVPHRVPTAEVVPGDVLLLSEGDAVGADGRLIEAASLTVAEASLTGESEPVLKDPATLAESVALGDRTNMVFSGTAITRGRGRAVVTATGTATEIGRIASLLGETKDERTPLQREIDSVGRTLGIAVLAVAAIVVAAILLTSRVNDASDLADVLLVGVSLAVAAVPEGLPAVLSVVLALGVQRMARKNAIVKQLSSVETLGSASAICSDKTGTLTRNEMTIQRIVTHSGEVDITGVGYRPEGGLMVGGKPIEAGPTFDEARAVISLGTLANDASVREEHGEWIVQGDPTEAAFVVAGRKAGLIERLEGRYRRVGEVPFTSERKLMSTLQEDAERDRRVVVATKGAPDVLLARCTQERVADEPRQLDEDRRQQILATVDDLAGQAYRTLGTAYRPLSEEITDRLDEEQVEHDLVFAGVVGIIDPPRAEARVAIDDARRAGIRVLMITGDHPRTAARIAEELDIVAADARTVAGVEIEELADAAFREVVREASVYARVAPEHKLRIVDALQADGYIVAMTGDGVNDAPALKRADIGIAMGITGTDVTKEAANMILADDNFATIVAAVREGRGIFSNIRKFLRYLLSSNAGEVLTLFLGVIGAGIIGLDAAGGAAAVPLLATQILWINLLTDAAPALAMGVDPPPDDVMSRPPRRLTDRVIDAPMVRGVVFVGLVMAGATLLTLDVGLPGGLVEGSGTLRHARTLAFTTLVLSQLFNCFNARSERVSAFHNLFANRLLWGAIGLSGLLQVAVVYVPFLNRPFDTTPLRAADWVLCTAMASTVLWANELRKLLARRSARSSNV
jgi:magnesium-transporting ATPase (P-type)